MSNKGDEAREYFGRVRALMFARSGQNQAYPAAVTVFDIVTDAMEAEADQERPMQKVPAPPQPVRDTETRVEAASGVRLGGGTGGVEKPAPQPSTDAPKLSTDAPATGAVVGPLS